MLSGLQMQCERVWKVSLLWTNTFTESSIVDRHPYQMLCVPWAQRHHCKGQKPVWGNKHLSCANWSVKCTNCGGEVDVSAGVTALGLGAMSGPGMSWGTPSPPPPPHPPTSRPPSLSPAMLAKGYNGNYYLLDVCLISSYSAWLAITEPQGVYCHPPSLLRGGSGKIISVEHLDHLFRAPGVSHKPNCPPLCTGFFSLHLSLPVAHECVPWKVHQARCQKASSKTNTNASWRSSCEKCESAKCMINWAYRGALWLWSAVASCRHCYDYGYLGS